MLLSRKWLNEFVPVEAKDRAFAEDMTLSGSKVEVTAVSYTHLTLPTILLV